jgi:hypothetical protein
MCTIDAKIDELSQNPFAVFTEWSSEAAETAYAGLSSGSDAQPGKRGVQDRSRKGASLQKRRRRD